MNFDPTFPVYLGMSKKDFLELRRHGRLHNARTLAFTDSMKQAEDNARSEAEKTGEDVGMVIKFNTEHLFHHPIFLGTLMDDFIDNIFRFIIGFYEVVVVVVVIDEGGEYC